jgi:hypothetical protein
MILFEAGITAQNLGPRVVEPLSVAPIITEESMPEEAG